MKDASFNKANIFQWSARALIFCLTGVFSLFSADSFDGGIVDFKTIRDWLIHMIPSLVLLIPLLVFWKRFFVLACIYLTLGLSYLVVSWNKFPISVHFLITLPLIISSIFFFLAYANRKEIVRKT
jgi:hypothetical protein